jgi:hypothetical protein
LTPKIAEPISRVNSGVISMATCEKVTHTRERSVVSRGLGTTAAAMAGSVSYSQRMEHTRLRVNSGFDSQAAFTWSRVLT